MTLSKNIRTEEYVYSLPDKKIASYPLDKRDSSKLLVYNKGAIKDDKFRNIDKWLDISHHLIFNNTRVIRARLLFSKATGAKIELFCLEPETPKELDISLASKNRVIWKCLVGNLKKWKGEELMLKLSVGETDAVVSASLLGSKPDGWLIEFRWENETISFGEILEYGGHIPIPPYLNRKDEEIDKSRYQTVYSVTNGSVAAPTAGLHFTDDIITRIHNNGISTSNITLHVSAGTFKPVKSDTIGGHTMHYELFSVTRKVLESLKTTNVLSVGTTTVRTIESIYWLGVKVFNGYKGENDGILKVNQWEPYKTDPLTDIEKVIDSLLRYMDTTGVDSLEAQTNLIIVPGYSFIFTKGLITNFHMPGSTLLMLVAALIGEDWRKVYKYALDNKYRFLSYGDSSLLIPE